MFPVCYYVVFIHSNDAYIHTMATYSALHASATYSGGQASLSHEQTAVAELPILYQTICFNANSLFNVVPVCL